jgi:hypothetical protein
MMLVDDAQWLMVLVDAAGLFGWLTRLVDEVG